MQHPQILKIIAVTLASAFGLLGAPLTVSSYSMLNSAHGTFNYRDFAYVPCAGVCDITAEPLSGGAGKLTDGVSAALDWFEQGEDTEWIGWDSAQGLLNPVVTYFFSQSVTINTVTVWASNSLSGGVGLPSAAIIGGTNFAIPLDGTNTSPRALVFSGLNLTGSSVSVQLNQSSFPWVMIGEVSFDGSTGPTVIPEPTSLLLVGCALPILALLRRRFS